MAQRLQIGALWAMVIALTSGCAREHCDWSTVDDVVDVTGSGSFSGRALDEAVLSVSVGDVLIISTDDPADGDATGVSVIVSDYPTEPGEHPIVARVTVLPSGAEEAELGEELEVAGVLDLVDYEEESETNPSDGYTNGGTVTARDIQGSLTLSHDQDTAHFEFAIEQSLEESCFRCQGIEGCDF